jgi:sorting nexin-1/2
LHLSRHARCRADFQYGQFSVIRRFKDFVWLSERLGEEFPGVINPPLPDKETLKRFDAEHIEKRRAELERYLARVAAHSELSGSAFFMTFLQVCYTIL